MSGAAALDPTGETCIIALLNSHARNRKVAGRSRLWGPHDRSDRPPVTLPHDIADLLEAFAREVEQLPGVSRRNPHIFGERKSDLVHKMRCQAKEFRTVPRAAVKPAAIVPGTIIVGRREIRVEVRRRA